jgi:serine/threonine-protein kinase
VTDSARENGASAEEGDMAELRPDEEPAADPLDSALRWAFAPADDAASVVMQSIHLCTGQAVRLTLRDLGGGRAPLRVKESGVDWSGGTAGRYAVRGELARGGVGTILLARDNDLGRDVAVKILREQLADDPAILQRFVEEAQIGGQLQHPGIVPVYELGLDARQRPFFTMKLVQGETLAQVLAARARPSDEHARLLETFARVCETVAYAHARGVVHRDLKPGNVMVGEFGEVLVMDWGFAKVLGRQDEARADGSGSIAVHGDPVSVAGTVLGTPAYMPPEQAAGRIDQLDARADVFALGAILCEILTGSPPYVGSDLLQQARAGVVAPALGRLAASGADRALIELAERCLQPAPAARPESAQSVRAALAELAASAEARAEAGRVAAATADARVAEERKRRRLWLVLVGTGLGLVAVASALVLGHRERVQHTVREAREALSRAWQRLAADDPTSALAALEQARTVVRAGTPDAEILAAVDVAAARIVPVHRDFAIEKKVLETLLRTDFAQRPAGRELVEALRSVGLDVLQPPEHIVAQARALAGDATPVLLRALHELAVRPKDAPRPPGYAIVDVLAALDVLDDDGAHRRVRRAWADADTAALRTLLDDFDAEAAPASAFELLGAAFLHCGAFGDAMEALASAHALDPQSFWINQRLAVLCRTSEPPRHVEARWHTELAMLAFPGRRFGIEPVRPPGPPNPGGPPWRGRRGR